MVVLYLGALAAIALSLLRLTAFASAVQQRTGHSGRVVTIGKFSLKWVGAGSARWRWSRHPNYLFGWFGWLAYPVIAFGADYPWRWATLLALLFMYRILVHVTGIPPLKEQMLRSRGERYRHYQLRASMFFPLPPQKGVVT